MNQILEDPGLMNISAVNDHYQDKLDVYNLASYKFHLSKYVFMIDSYSNMYNEPSKREIEVLKLIASELTTKEIAERLYVSCETINTHRKNLLSKMNARNTAGMIRKAFQKQILSIYDDYSS